TEYGESEAVLYSVRSVSSMAARPHSAARAANASATRASTPGIRSAAMNVPPAISRPAAVKNAVVGHPPRLYRSLMSGRRSVSTRTGTNRASISAATAGSAYVVPSISWHARHHAAVIESRTGLPSREARANAAASQGSHSTMPRLCVLRQSTIVRMFLLRFVALLALVVWVGGLAALGGIAAPALFDV